MSYERFPSLVWRDMHLLRCFVCLGNPFLICSAVQYLAWCFQVRNFFVNANFCILILVWVFLFRFCFPPLSTMHDHCFTWQLLREKGLLPELSLQVDNIVCALDDELQGYAAMAANVLREKGQTVDLVLESKPLKWYKILSSLYFCLSLDLVYCRALWLRAIIWSI